LAAYVYRPRFSKEEWLLLADEAGGAAGSEALREGVGALLAFICGW
jgi:hypothetical protein